MADTRATRFDAIVVGAGIVGAACARDLAREGMRVLVLDARRAGSGATAAAMGHLVVLDDSPAQLALTALATRRWRELASELPDAVAHDPCGTIWIAEDDVQLDVLRTKHRRYAGQGVASDLLGPRELAALEPQLRPGLAGGLHVLGDGVLDQARAAQFLLRQARDAGVSVRESCRADRIAPHAVHCDGEVLHAEVIVVAAGAESPALVPELPIVPRKGHLAVVELAPGSVRHQLVELGYLASAHDMTAASVAFNVQPRPQGRVIVGASRELVGWEAAVNPDVLGRMLARAAAFLPALAEHPIARAWTGFRPATPDKLPLIGPWPDVESLWIATGHEGFGITTALATAEILAATITGRAPPIDPTPFAPARVLSR